MVFAWGCGEKETVVFNPCGDGKLSGQETDVDCGGPSCDPCPIGKTCLLDGDCDSGLCLSGVCAVPKNCGNGQIDPNETCDGDCPESCDDGDDCTTDIMTGSAEDCTADCFYSPVTSCTDGDGCCPPGCASSNDNDCADGGFALRLNAGLESGTSTFDGKEFVPLSQYLVDGTANSSMDAGLGIPISGTAFDPLYQVELYIPAAKSFATFTIPVENGARTVHLHFVDWTPLTSDIGDRVFHVDLQGERVLSDFDIIADSGKNTAVVKSFDVSVTTGTIELTITNSVFAAEIAAIEILNPGEPYLGQDIAEPICGDGHIGTGESCDDGNRANGDGCSLSCEVESGWTCTTADPSECEPTSTSDTNSIDLIWADSFDENLGDPAHINYSYPLFHAVPRTFPIDGSFPKINAWYEVMEGGDGSSCSLTTNTATNTVVELGALAAWIYYENGGWEEYVHYSTQHGYTHPSGAGGVKQPADGDPYATILGYYGCPGTAGQLRLNHMGYSPIAGVSETGNGLYKPNFAWIYHGWGGNQVLIDYARNPKAVLVTLWARLVVEDDQLPDDRHLSNYVIHVGADKKELNGRTEQGGVGPSRWKRVTSEWQPFNFLTGGWTKAQFEATNPPIAQAPQ